MLKVKVAQKFPIVAQKVAEAVFTKELSFSKLPKKFTIIWAYFAKNICFEEL